MIYREGEAEAEGAIVVSVLSGKYLTQESVGEAEKVDNPAAAVVACKSTWCGGTDRASVGQR